MLHHQGIGISIFQKWYNIGARSNIVTLTFFIKERLKREFLSFVVSRKRVLLSKLYSTPKSLKISRKVFTSPIIGTFLRVIFHFISKLAASIGRTAFLLPLIFTFHSRLFHQETTNIYKHI
jgi:hypothetical protein